MALSRSFCQRYHIGSASAKTRINLSRKKTRREMKAGKTEVTFFFDDPPFATKATAMLVPVGKRGDEESRGADLYSRRGQLGRQCTHIQ